MCVALPRASLTGCFTGMQRRPWHRASQLATEFHWVQEWLIIGAQCNTARNIDDIWLDMHQGGRCTCKRHVLEYAAGKCPRAMWQRNCLSRHFSLPGTFVPLLGTFVPFPSVRMLPAPVIRPPPTLLNIVDFFEVPLQSAQTGLDAENHRLKLSKHLPCVLAQQLACLMPSNVMGGRVPAAGRWATFPTDAVQPFKTAARHW